MSKYATSKVLVTPKLLNNISTATSISVEPNANISGKEAKQVIRQNKTIDYLSEIHLVTKMQAREAKSSAVPENIAKR